MNPVRWALLRVRAIVARRVLEREMKEELSAHFERAEERLMARGRSRVDARNAARREFGNVASIEEDARDARGARIIESLIAHVGMLQGMLIGPDLNIPLAGALASHSWYSPSRRQRHGSLLAVRRPSTLLLHCARNNCEKVR